MCFVIDNDSWGYYLFFNIPIIIYIGVFFYTIIRYEIGIERRKPPTHFLIDNEQQLIPVQIPSNCLSPTLYNKIH